MAIIEQRIRLVGSKGSRDVVALFDSGASYSIIQPGLAREVARPERLPTPKHFGTAEKGRKVTAKECVRLDFKLNGHTLSDEFMVVPGITESVIIGAATMQKWRMKLDFEHDRVIVDPRVTKLRLLRLGNSQ
ncbi:MAG: retropepsin-like aspartic protease [candidate division WOR-3 bacterium]